MLSNLKSKYSNTIEELFSRHLERMIMKRHVVPKYKVRYSPFFSDRYFKFNTNDAIPLQLSCNLVRFSTIDNSFETHSTFLKRSSCDLVSISPNTLQMKTSIKVLP